MKPSERIYSSRAQREAPELHQVVPLPRDNLGIGHPYAHLFRNEGLKLMKAIEMARGVRARYHRAKEAIEAGFLTSLIVYPESFVSAYDQIAEGNFAQLLPLLTRGVEGMIDLPGL